jgi:hypothetical protein
VSGRKTSIRTIRAINFKPSQGPGVTVTSSAVTGFAWAENVGWINLSPAEGGVMNDGMGNLSGFAWGENVGWINFAPIGAGVTILGNGRFVGFAWGENIGWINFDIPSGVRTSFTRAAPVPLLRASGILLALAVLALIAFQSVRRVADLPRRYARSESGNCAVAPPSAMIV